MLGNGADLSQILCGGRISKLTSKIFSLTNLSLSSTITSLQLMYFKYSDTTPEIPQKNENTLLPAHSKLLKH